MAENKGIGLRGEFGVAFIDFFEIGKTMQLSPDQLSSLIEALVDLHDAITDRESDDDASFEAGVV